LEPYEPYPPVRGRQRRRGGFDPDDLVVTRHRPGVPAERTAEPAAEEDDEPSWSTWADAVHGPQPPPVPVMADGGAVDTDRGVLKTGKEADVHLVERAVPGGDACLLAVKRYRGSDHRLFHRDAGYLEGRRVRRSREMRAMARRTEFGRDLVAVQWAAAEFAALSRLWAAGPDVRVPYPVQLRGTELMLEFLGTPDGVAAPRLAQLRPEGGELDGLWDQCRLGVLALARMGLAHGDLSPYNTLVHEGRLVLIDLPQVVDVVANPQGPAFLSRDVAVMATWFQAHGTPADAEHLTREALAAAGLSA